MYSDIASKIGAAPAIGQQSLTGSSATVNGSTIDLQAKNAKGIAFIFNCTAFTSGSVTPLIEESSDGSTWSAVADDFLVGTEADAALTATGTTKIGYVGKEPYVRASGVASSATLDYNAVAIIDSVSVPAS